MGEVGDASAYVSSFICGIRGIRQAIIYREWTILVYNIVDNLFTTRYTFYGSARPPDELMPAAGKSTLPGRLLRALFFEVIQ